MPCKTCGSYSFHEAKSSARPRHIGVGIDDYMAAGDLKAEEMGQTAIKHD